MKNLSKITSKKNSEIHILKALCSEWRYSEIYIEVADWRNDLEY
jgi:hypothetical protein